MTKAGTVSDEIIWLNTGQWPFFLGFTTSPVAFERTIKRLKVPEKIPFMGSDHANATTHTLEKDGKLTIIVAMQPPSRKTSREAWDALLVHELVHVLQLVQEHYAAGKSLGVEADAYFVQYFFMEIISFARKTGRYKAVRPVAKKRPAKGDPVNLTQE